jgi:hypothetical protein
MNGRTSRACLTREASRATIRQQNLDRYPGCQRFLHQVFAVQQHQVIVVSSGDLSKTANDGMLSAGDSFGGRHRHCDSMLASLTYHESRSN